MLCEAAAERWDVEAAECDTRRRLRRPRRQAARLRRARGRGRRGSTPPDKPPLRPIGSGKLAGQPLPRLDLPAKSDGSAALRRRRAPARMLFASVRLAPPGGRLTGFSRAGREAAAGLDRPGRRDELAGRARRELVGGRARADRAPRRSFTGPARPTAAPSALCSTSARQRRVRHACSSAAIMRRRSRARAPLAATYSIAPAQHRRLEAPRRDRALQRRPARSLGADPGARSGPRRGGRGGGIGERAMSRSTRCRSATAAGGRCEAEADPDRGRAGARARAAGAADLSASVAQNHDAVRPPLLARMAALPGAGGTIAAWSARIAGAPGLEALAGPGAGQGRIPPSRPRGATPPYAIADDPDRCGRRRAADPHRLYARRRRGADCLRHRKLHRRNGARRWAPSRSPFGWACSAALRGWRGRSRPRRRSAAGTAAAPGSTHGARLRLAVRLAHRPARRSDASAPTSGSRCRGWSRRSIAGGSSIPGWSASRSKAGCSPRLAGRRRSGARIRRRHAARRADARSRLSSGCTTSRRSRSS